MATYTKLRDGSWGIRATEAVTAGQSVTVTKKSGESKTELVRNVLWSGNGVWLCAIETARPAYQTRGRRRSSGGRYECEECGDMVTPGTACWETGLTH
jgi:hypothetical protein